jgi:hypothetical protein
LHPAKIICIAKNLSVCGKNVEGFVYLSYCPEQAFSVLARWTIRIVSRKKSKESEGIVMNEIAFDNVPQLTESLFDRFGRYFDLRKHNADQDDLLGLLARHYPEYSHLELNQAIEKVIVARNLELIYWPDFLCLLARFLRGRWYKVTHNPGFSGGVSGLFLMTDGTVLVQEYRGSRWKKLTPDITGSYINGSWSDIAPMNTARLYYASAVLADGRLLICGGEYEGTGGAVESNKCEIYDPVSDTWSDITPPAGWTRIGDAACALLPDGRFLLGNLDDTRTAIFDPATDSFTAGPTKRDDSSEESWVLLPDNTVVTIHTDASRTTEKYIVATNSWVDAGNTPFVLPEASSKEIGAGVLLPNGRAFFIGATNQTALYTMPTISTDPGSWTAGPIFPNDPNGMMVGAKDAPACLLTNGRVLCAVGPVNGVSNNFLSPTYFYEYTGSTLVRVDDPPTASGKIPYNGRLLLLPNGQVLFANDSQEMYVYSYFSCINNSWRPAINHVSSTLYPIFSYTLTGTQLNGLSQAVGYGDDFTAATNYPLVRLKKVGENKVYYARTFNHSTMGVATGSVEHSTTFKLPHSIVYGDYDLTVVANGIPSFSKRVRVRPLIIGPDYTEFNRLFGSLADGPLWVWGPHGPIPVDPWGPQYYERAKELREQMMNAYNGLKQLGLEVFNERLELAAKQAGDLVFDEISEEEEEQSSKGKPRKRKHHRHDAAH